MPRCPSCGEKVSEYEPYCPSCGEPNPSEKAAAVREMEKYGEKRKQVLATFLLGMFGIMLIPFFRLLLAVISFGIAIPMSLFYTWKKHQAKKELETGNY